jgi:hypothetical protein
VALQRATGNEAVVEILRRAGHPSAQEVHEHDAGCGHEQAFAQSAEAPVQRRSAVHDVLRGDTAVQRATVVQREELAIQDGNEGPTTIRSASDLLVWLVGHPTRPAPRNWAEPAVLQRVLARLEQVDGPVGHDAVWNAVREVLARQEAQLAGDSSSDSDSSSEGGGFFRRGDDSSSDEEEDSDTSSTASSRSLSGDQWDEGEWGTDTFGVSAPLEFRREMPAEELAERRRVQSESLSGYRLVGFHGTQIESLGSLITDGPDLSRIGQANGIGKGAGFYVAPVVAPTGMKAPGTTAAKNNAKTWGKFLVAVYVKNDADVQQYFGDSDSEDGVGFESAGSAGPGPAMMFHGSDELVVPAELFDKVKLVRNADDMAMMSDPGHAAVAYEDGVSQHKKSKK